MKSMKVKADFHIHTHHSPDSGSSASDILGRARAAGLDVIGVTDHGTTKGGIEVRSLSKGKPLVLVGQEVLTDSGEFIVFGPEKDIPEGMELRKAFELAKSMGGFTLVSHPFDRTRSGIGADMLSVLEHIDAVEALNSRCLLARPNKKALAFAKEHEIPVVSGSDAHFADEIGHSFTELEIEGRLSEKSVLDAIAAGRTVLHGKRSGVGPHIRTALYKLKK
jgi:predicted metal-dependent phosphoesterase TrpH